VAIYTDREAFIPYRRADVIELCVDDGKLAPSDVQKFRDFCEILTAYYHFKFQRALENLKNNFAPFNPDTDTKSRLIPTPAECQAMQNSLVKELADILEQANYIPLKEEDLQASFAESSLVPLHTSVDFDDYEHTVFYYRGEKPTTITTKKFYFQEVKRTFNIFERVTLLLKFKDAAYFEAKGKKIEDLPFTPGKIYLYLYKNIPKFDLELLYPNVHIGMTTKDRLMFGVPAIGAAIPILIKVLPSLGVMIGIIALLIWGPSAITKTLDVTEDSMRNYSPVLMALLSMVVALGGFAVKQYTNYKNKQIVFQKTVTDTLFFRNIDTNGGVFNMLIDSAEEESTKEIILAYYHLLTHPTPLTQEQLDDLIEKWLEQKFETKIDFDVTKAVENLMSLRGQFVDSQTNQETEAALLTRTPSGHCQVLDIDEAKIVLDYVWDNIFQYNN